MKKLNQRLRANKNSRTGQVSVLGKLNTVLLIIIVALSLGVIYSTHQSRLITSQKSEMSRLMEEQNIRNGQLMLEEGTFARTALVERKAIEELHLQKITLEQVVRVTP